MADDSWEIETTMDFHPSDVPHGMKEYVLSDLTPVQQSKLNYRKREEIRSNQRYLADHPEIRGIVTMILRVIMRTRPKYNIYEVIGSYFTKSSVDLKEEIYSYLETREKNLATKSSIVQQRTSITESILSEIEDEEVEEVLVVSDMEEKIEEQEERSGVHWEYGKVEEEKEEEENIEKVCGEILEQIVQNVFEEGSISLGSIASFGFPVDYEDHAYSLHSDDDDDDDDNNDYD